MKKLSLLVAVIIAVLAFSVVFATEEEPLLISPAPNAEEETMTTTSVETTGEDIAAEPTEEAVEPSTENVEPTAETTEVQEAPTVVSTNETEQKSNTTITGAIIAIVIVVIIVALAALIQKK